MASTFNPHGSLSSTHIAAHHLYHLGGLDPTHAGPYWGETLRLPSVCHQDGQVGRSVGWWVFGTNIEIYRIDTVKIPYAG